MQISQFFVNGDIKGAIAYMRNYEEFKDILPAYVAIFEDQKYRTYEIPDNLNDILRLYQIYFRDTFYCGLPEAEAADKLRTGLRALLNMPDADEALLAERLQSAFEAEGYHALFGKTQGYYGPYIWRNTVPTVYRVELPDGTAEYMVNIDSTEFEKMWNSESSNYANGYTAEQRAEIISAIKEQLPPDDVQALHFADILLQNIQLGKYIDDSGELNAQRDRMMAENTLWILQQEQARGNSRILISGHNNHIIRCENAGTPVLGSLLAEELGSGYFAIGTDFYKSVCNLPKPYTGKRITHTFYSYDPLAKASKKCGFDVSFLDFSKVPEGSALMEYIANSVQMGSFGEYYSILMNFVPRSYRVWRAPQDAYDAMIFVTDTAPIEIESLNK